MIELFLILFQFFLFIYLYSINIFINFKERTKQFEYNETLSLNFLLHSNLILILSLFNLNIIEITYLYLVTVFVGYFFFFKNNIANFLKNKSKNIIFLICLFITSFTIMVEIGSNLSISWDAEGFWLNKTLNFYNNNTIEDLYKLTNPHYPFLGALLNATYWKIGFIKYEYAGRLIFAFIYILSILNLVEIMKLAKIYKFILFFLIVISTYDYQIFFSGNQEILIFTLICIAMKNLYQINERTEFFSLRIFSILMICNLLIWTKQEGIFYAIFLILSLFFLRNSNFKKSIIYLTFVLIFIVIRLLVFRYYNLELSLNKTVLSDTSIYSLFNKISYERFALVIKYFIISFFQNFFFFFRSNFLFIK